MYNVFLTFKNCLSISLNHLEVKPQLAFKLEGTNILGSSYFNHITLPDNNSIRLLYNETHVDRRHHNILTLNNCTAKQLKIDMVQRSYGVTLKIAYTQIQHCNEDIISVKELGTNEVLIINCQFISNKYSDYLFSFASSSSSNVQFINCQFINNRDANVQSSRQWIVPTLPNPSLIELYPHVNIGFINCIFIDYSMTTAGILQTHYSMHAANIHVIIKNTSFTSRVKHELSSLTFSTSLITLSNTKLLLEDSVVFSSIDPIHSIISLTKKQYNYHFWFSRILT